MDYSGAKYLAELPAGKKAFRRLTGLTLGFPGSIAWDGAYLAATDQNYQYNYLTAIHRFTVSGSAVTIVRTTVLTDTCYPYRNWMVAVQPFIGGTTRKKNAVVAGNLNCPNRENAFQLRHGRQSETLTAVIDGAGGSLRPVDQRAVRRPLNPQHKCIKGGSAPMDSPFV